MVMVIGNGHGNLKSNLDGAVCILYSINTFGKCMHPTILPLAIGK